MTTKKANPLNHYVEIVEDSTGEVVKRMGPMNAGKADRVENGASINLNHERFSIRIIRSPLMLSKKEGATG